MADIGLSLYRKMVLCRTAEQAICREYARDGMKTPMHMSMGAEAIAAGVCEALGPDDQLVGTYRSHAIYICRTLETDLFFAEMYGRAPGVAKGKGGSMHLSAPGHGLICTSAIVATGIPVAVGAAFANRRLGNGRVVASFFGDGAVDEGVFWESLNAACLWQLPVLFVYEDNDLAVHATKRHRHGYESIARVVSGFKCRFYDQDTTDVEHIHDTASRAVAEVRAGGGPVFLRTTYYRYLEHVGVNEDFSAGYRDPDTYATWRLRDPIALQRARLEQQLGAEVLDRVDAEAEAQVQRSIEFATAAPFPGKTAIFEDLFA